MQQQPRTSGQTNLPVCSGEVHTEIMDEHSCQFSPDSYWDSFYKASVHRPRMNCNIFEEENVRPVCNSETLVPLSADVFRPSVVPVLDKTEVRRSSLTMMLNNASSIDSNSTPHHTTKSGSGSGSGPESPRTVTEVPPSALRKSTEKVVPRSIESKWDQFRSAATDTDSDSDYDSSDESSDDASPSTTGGCHPSVFAFLHDQYMRSHVKKMAFLNFDMTSRTMSQLRRLHEKSKKKENSAPSNTPRVQFTADDDVNSTTASSSLHPSARQVIQIPIGGDDRHQDPTSAAAAAIGSYFMMSL